MMTDHMNDSINDESAVIQRWEAILHDFLRAASKSIARGQPGLAKDLYQEALICLWEMDPRHYDESDIGYVRTTLTNRMIDVKRAEESRRFWDRPADRHGSRRIPVSRRRKCA